MVHRRKVSLFRGSTRLICNRIFRKDESAIRTVLCDRFVRGFNFGLPTKTNPLPGSNKSTSPMSSMLSVTEV